MVNLEVFLRIFSLFSQQEPFHLYKHLKSDQYEFLLKEKYRRDLKWLAWWDKWSNVLLNYLVWKSVLITFIIIYVDYFRKETSFLAQMRAIVPDPFNEARIFMSMITLGVPLTLYVSLTSWLKSMRKYRMYMHTIRFILEPKLEVERVDMMAKEIVEKQIACIERARWNLIDELCCSSSVSSTSQGRKTMERRNSGWLSLSFSLKQFAKLKHVEHYFKFRPYIYTPEWLKISRKKVKSFLIIMIAYTYTNLIIFILSVVYKNTSDRCKKSNQMNCDIMTAYSASELIYLVEILLLSFNHATNFIYLTMQLYLAVVNLHNLVKGLGHELTKLSEQLRYINSRLYATEGKKVHQLMVEASIKLGLFDEDVKSIAKTVSSLFALSLVIVAILVVTFLLGYQVDHKVTLANSLNLDLPVALIYLCAWFTCNITAIVTAYTNRCITRTVALYWPINAELMHFENRKQARRTNLGYLANQWHRLSSYLTDTEANQNAVRPFGLELTYGDVVEYNFYIISAFTFVFK